MPLRLVNPNAGKERIDIVAVPAIGSNPDAIWRYPGTEDAGGKDGRLGFKSIFHDISRARVYLYSYVGLWASDAITIESYARDLLVQLQSITDIGNRPLHLVAHSSGGLVLKTAMVLARTSEIEVHKKIVASCIGVAFFGVPHSGGIYFSENDYRIQDAETRRMIELMGSYVRKHFLSENSAFLEDIHQKFALVAIRLPRIWTFVETIPTEIWRIKGRLSKSYTVLNDVLVQTWSATVSTANMPIINEQVISVPSTHAKLSRFGDDSNSRVFNDYISDLRLYTSKLGMHVNVDHGRVEDHVFVDLHAFYSSEPDAGTLPIKIISDHASLRHLLKVGPNACLEEQVHSHMGEIKEDERRNIHRSRAVPTLVFTSPEGDDTQEDTQMHSDSQSEGGDSQASEGGSDSKLVPKEQKSVIRTPSGSLVDSLERFPGRRSDRDLQSTLPGYRFRWIHVPATNMSWVPSLLNTIGEECGEARLSVCLLHDEVWSSRQYEALHGSPHGRFMRPSCGAFFPQEYHGPNPYNSSIGNLKSPIDDAQLFIYMPYLNWDSYGSLLSRNALVKERIQAGSLAPPREDILGGKSLEAMLIWQYMYDSANFPYHLRRSLDQFGYPTLADTAARDSDQILYKWWIRNRQEQERQAGFRVKEHKLHSNQLYEMMKADIARRRGYPATYPEDFESIEEQVESDAKVLMVDQLWLWVVNSDTIVTFFPFKEDGKMEAFMSQADLRSAVLEKIKGHPRYSHQCTNTFDLAALIVLHAITEFVEKPRDKDLEVLRIFEQHMNNLSERQNASFREFRRAHREISRHGMISSKPLDNSDDLGALLELRDIEDELKMLNKLFNDQKTVLTTLIELYQNINTLDAKNSLTQGQAWLHRAQQRLNEYEWQINEMIKTCHATQESYMSLLDMKQKQANADEAWFARQSAQVLEGHNGTDEVTEYTANSILQLPLSFFTSLFGMNVREWSGTPTNLPIHTVIVLMMSISAAVIVVALLLAFNKPIRITVIWFFSDGYRKALAKAASLLTREQGDLNDADFDKLDDEWQPSPRGKKTKRM